MANIYCENCVVCSCYASLNNISVKWQSTSIRSFSTEVLFKILFFCVCGIFVFICNLKAQKDRSQGGRLKGYGVVVVCNRGTQPN